MKKQLNIKRIPGSDTNPRTIYIFRVQSGKRRWWQLYTGDGKIRVTGQTRTSAVLEVWAQAARESGMSYEDCQLFYNRLTRIEGICSPAEMVMELMSLFPARSREEE